jgi:hypothetical protein
MNRGISRRTVFEDVCDVRYFLSCLARAIRAGWIEVHAYCLMTTHFHLFVRSTDTDAREDQDPGRIRCNHRVSPQARDQRSRR